MQFRDLVFNNILTRIQGTEQFMSGTEEPMPGFSGSVDNEVVAGCCTWRDKSMGESSYEPWRNVGWFAHRRGTLHNREKI